MGLSSGRVAAVLLGTLMLSPFAGTPVAAAPAAVAVHPGALPGGAHPALPRFQRVGPGVGGRLSRRFPRYGFGDGYLGAAGVGLATTALAGGGYGGEGYDGLPPGAVAPPEPPPIPPMPACPMIIKIGPGLDHPVQTRVIYGAPACN